MRRTIHRASRFGNDDYTYYPVAIVGAGESGIAMGCKLKEEFGFDQFRVFDRHAGIGGTWWINRYPGVACDVPAVFYSFSFSPNYNWSSFFPPGAEIRQHLQDVCEKYAITDKFQLNTDVVECHWHEDEELWEITLRHFVPGAGDLSSKDRGKKIKELGESSVYCGTETVRAKVLVSAVGGLVEPRGWPENVPGRKRFQGDIFHSARWDYSVNLKDKDVVVVGTGCSAAQFVPELIRAHGVKSVTQLMRSPPWVRPKEIPPGGTEWWNKWSSTIFNYIPGSNQLLRQTIAAFGEWDFRLFDTGPWYDKQRRLYEEGLLWHLRKTVPEKYHKILTPDYGVGCKRRIADDTVKGWFVGLNDPRIELTTQPLTSIQEKSVTIGPGALYPKSDSEEAYPARTLPADVIVLSNGFDVTRWLHPLKVVGKGGEDIVELMEKRGGPQAYQGTAMDGFPNFFMIFGPNTATGHTSVILASENMVLHALKFIKKILKGDVETVEVKEEAERAFMAEVQRKLKGMVWSSDGCWSWYVRDDGWNSTVYPWTQIDFAYRCLFPRWQDWNIKYTRRGLLKQWIGRAVRLLAFISAFWGAYRTRKTGSGLGSIRLVLRQIMSVVLGAVVEGV